MVAYGADTRRDQARGGTKDPRKRSASLSFFFFCTGERRGRACHSNVRISHVCSGLGRPPMPVAPGARLGYSKRYFLSEMFGGVAALCLRSTVLPARRELWFAERSVLAARTVALDSRSRCNLLATG